MVHCKTKQAATASVHQSTMTTIPRRRFLQSAAAASATIAFPQVLRSAEAGARDKVRVAVIGVTGRGGDNRKELVNTGLADIVALCDVDSNSLATAAKTHPEARTFRDYRRMFDEMADGIDAVLVATPDHHHFPASMRAIKLGKHVYCEKPLTHSVWEARELAKAAREKKVATQMGTQGHSGEGIRLLTEWIAAGAIGTVREVHIWTDRPAGWWPQGVDRPEGEDPAPKSLDWDLWLGPAPHRPFKARHPEGLKLNADRREAYHPFVWRGWWDFGTGALGDIGSHSFDLPFTALKLAAPTSVEAVTVSDRHKETGPLFSDIVFNFPTSNQNTPVKITWYDGRNRNTPTDSPAYAMIKQMRELAELSEDARWPEGGQLYIGDKGKILVSGASRAPRLVPESRMKDFNRPAKTVPRSIGHHKEWLTAILDPSAPRPGANFDYAGPLAEAVLLGNISLRLDKKINWDPAGLKATNAPEAASLIRREYRKGWEV